MKLKTLTGRDQVQIHIPGEAKSDGSAELVITELNAEFPYLSLSGAAWLALLQWAEAHRAFRLAREQEAER